MIKVVAMYSLPDGTDPDEMWKYHTEVHASDIKRVYGPRLKKYVINRVSKVLAGEPRFFALMETWFESEEALAEADENYKTLRTYEGKTIAEDFNSRVTQRFRAVVEEKEITL